MKKSSNESTKNPDLMAELKKKLEVMNSEASERPMSSSNEEKGESAKAGNKVNEKRKADFAAMLASRKAVVNTLVSVTIPSKRSALDDARGKFGMKGSYKKPAPKETNNNPVAEKKQLVQSKSSTAPTVTTIEPSNIFHNQSPLYTSLISNTPMFDVKLTPGYSKSHFITDEEQTYLHVLCNNKTAPYDDFNSALDNLIGDMKTDGGYKSFGSPQFIEDKFINKANYGPLHLLCRAGGPKFSNEQMLSLIIKLNENGFSLTTKADGFTPTDYFTTTRKEDGAKIKTELQEYLLGKFNKCDDGSAVMKLINELVATGFVFDPKKDQSSFINKLNLICIDGITPNQPDKKSMTRESRKLIQLIELLVKAKFPFDESIGEPLIAKLNAMKDSMLSIEGGLSEFVGFMKQLKDKGFPVQMIYTADLVDKIYSHIAFEKNVMRGLDLIQALIKCDFPLEKEKASILDVFKAGKNEEFVNHVDFEVGKRKINLNSSNPSIGETNELHKLCNANIGCEEFKTDFGGLYRDNPEKLATEINAKDVIGTPLHYLCLGDHESKGFVDKVNFLIKAGADLMAVNQEEKTPYQYVLDQDRAVDNFKNAIGKALDPRRNEEYKKIHGKGAEVSAGVGGGIINVTFTLPPPPAPTPPPQPTEEELAVKNLLEETHSDATLDNLCRKNPPLVNYTKRTRGYIDLVPPVAIVSSLAAAFTPEVTYEEASERHFRTIAAVGLLSVIWGAARYAPELMWVMNQDAYISRNFTKEMNALRELEKSSSISEGAKEYLTSLEKEIMKEGNQSAPDLEKMDLMLRKANIVRVVVLNPLKEEDKERISVQSQKLCASFQKWGEIQKQKDLSWGMNLLYDVLTPTIYGVAIGTVSVFAGAGSCNSALIATGTAAAKSLTDYWTKKTKEEKYTDT